MMVKKLSASPGRPGRSALVIYLSLYRDLLGLGKPPRPGRPLRCCCHRRGCSGDWRGRVRACCDASGQDRPADGQGEVLGFGLGDVGRSSNALASVTTSRRAGRRGRARTGRRRPAPAPARPDGVQAGRAGDGGEVDVVAVSNGGSSATTISSWTIPRLELLKTMTLIGTWWVRTVSSSPRAWPGRHRPIARSPGAGPRRSWRRSRGAGRRPWCRGPSGR
jgi:hypothetical protein